jgi:hypothetical protein
VRRGSAGAEDAGLVRRAASAAPAVPAAQGGRARVRRTMRSGQRGVGVQNAVSGAPPPVSGMGASPSTGTILTRSSTSAALPGREGARRDVGGEQVGPLRLGAGRRQRVATARDGAAGPTCPMRPRRTCQAALHDLDQRVGHHDLGGARGQGGQAAGRRQAAHPRGSAGAKEAWVARCCCASSLQRAGPMGAAAAGRGRARTSTGGASGPRASSTRSSTAASEGMRLGPMCVMMTLLMSARATSRSRQATGVGFGGVCAEHEGPVGAGRHVSRRPRAAWSAAPPPPTAPAARPRRRRAPKSSVKALKGTSMRTRSWEPGTLSR